MVSYLQNLFLRIATAVENNPASVGRHIYLFFAILTVRLTLEFFSNNRLFTLVDIIHIGLWFIFIVTVFLLQLHLFSKQDIAKITKLVFTFFSIALTAPIIDMILSGGKGVKMNYLSVHNWQDIAWSYLTVGGSSLTNGATLGIRIEIVLLVLACFNYIWLKRSSVLWAFLAAFSIYTVLFLSGTVPVVLNFIVKTLKLKFQQDDQSTILFLLSLDVLVLCLIVWRFSHGLIKTVFNSIAWLNTAIAYALAVYSALLAQELYIGNWQLTPTTLFWFPLLFFLGWVLIFYFTICQIHIQESRGDSFYFAVKNTLLFVGLLIAIAISYKTLFAMALTWALIFINYDAPLFLYRVPILRNIIDALILLSVCFIGFCTFGAPMIGFPKNILFLLLVIFTALGILKFYFFIQKIK